MRVIDYLNISAQSYKVDWLDIYSPLDSQSATEVIILGSWAINENWKAIYLSKFTYHVLKFSVRAIQKFT